MSGLTTYCLKGYFVEEHQVEAHYGVLRVVGEEINLLLDLNRSFDGGFEGAGDSSGDDDVSLGEGEEEPFEEFGGVEDLLYCHIDEVM